MTQAAVYINNTTLMVINIFVKKLNCSYIWRYIDVSCYLCTISVS